MQVNTYFVFGSTWLISMTIGVLLYRYFCKENRDLSYDIGASTIGAGGGVFGGILLAAAFRLDDSLTSLSAISAACGIACSLGLQRSFGSWINSDD